MVIRQRVLCRHRRDKVGWYNLASLQAHIDLNASKTKNPRLKARTTRFRRATWSNDKLAAAAPYLVDQLVECVLAVRPRFTPDDWARVSRHRF